MPSKTTTSCVGILEEKFSESAVISEITTTAGYPVSSLTVLGSLSVTIEESHPVLPSMLIDSCRNTLP